MGRVGAAVALAAPLAVAALLAGAAAAAAETPARDDAAADMGRQLLAGIPQSDSGYRAVRTAWAVAGLDLRRADALVRSASDQPDGAVVAFLRGVCAPGGWMSLPGERPRPGDLAVALSGTTPRRARLAMFVSAEDLIAPDPGSGHLRLMRRQEFLPDDGAGAAAGGPLPLPGAACHIDPSLMPGGGDPAVGPGWVALVDPGVAASQVDWAAEHPRDADSGPWHAVVEPVRSTAALLSQSLAAAISAGISAAAWLLANTGIGGAVVFASVGAVGHVLGTRFDGRRLHAVLTWILVGTVGVIVLGAGAPLLLVGLAGGLLGGASLLDVPVLGAAGRALWGAAGFVTTVITGVEDSDHATVGEVIFALASDAVVWARPAAVAVRVAEVGGRYGSAALRLGTALARRVPAVASIGGSAARGLRAGLGAAGTAADALMLRPHAWAHAGESVMRLLRGAPRELTALHPPVTPATARRTLLGTAVDLAGSLTWRRASLLSDLVGHAGSAAAWLHADIAAGAHSWPLEEPLLRDIVARIPASRRAAILEVALPRVRELATLSHLHSGARTVSTLAAGDPLQTIANPAAAPSPPPLAPRVTGEYAGPA